MQPIAPPFFFLLALQLSRSCMKRDRYVRSLVGLRLLNACHSLADGIRRMCVTSRFTEGRCDGSATSPQGEALKNTR